ncbi:MAG: VWA domain-containing protein [Leptospirillia bacterium]
MARRRFDALPAVLMPAAGGETVHLLTDDAVVHSLDAATLEEVAAPIPLPDFLGPRPYIRRTKANYMQAALSADGRHVFANRWAGREISVADLVGRTASTVALNPDVKYTGGIAVDHTGTHRGLVAVHGMDQVMVYRFTPPAAMAEVARGAVNAPNLRAADEIGPLLALAWSRSGERIVAATDDGAAEFVMLRFDGPGLVAETVIAACPEGYNSSNDVVTLNRPQIVPTATASPTANASHTPDATATHTASPSATPTIAASPTPTATVQPRIYLPVVQKDACGPVAVDVVVVLDASKSMDEPARDGRTKTAVAREAVAGFYGLFSMPPSQAALVAFNAEAHLVQPLTSDVAALEAALGAVATAPLTRIDLGLAKAREELTGPNHVAGHARAILLLTDGRQHPGDPATAIAEARLAEEDGAVVLVVGVGPDADGATLAQIATGSEWFAGNVAPADLVAAVAALGRSLRCSPGG